MISLVKISEPEQMSNPPLGLLYIGDALKKAGYDVKVLHCSSEEIGKCAHEVIKSNPLFVGFSVFTAGGIRSSVRMCKEIRRLSKNIPIVWGNSHSTLLPEQCLNEPYIDIIVFGEGEETIVDLARAIEKRQPLSEVKGIGYKENGELKFTEPRPFMKNLDKYRLDWDLVDINRYIRPYWDLKRVIPFVTSRGCPHNCSFCHNLVFNKRRWRAHSIDFVVSEVERLKSEHGIDGIRFWDDNFFVDKRRAFGICGRIGLPYFADARIDYVDEEFCQRLKETNSKELCFGFESGSDRILKLMNKEITVSDTLKAVKILTRFGVHFSSSIIMGYPTEVKREFLETMKLVTELFEINPRTGFTTGLYLPYPGTPSYDLAIQEGFLPPKKPEGWDALDRWSYGLDVTWVDHITAFEAAKIRKYVQVIGILYSLNVPIFKKLAKYRLTTGNYFMDYDMRLWKWLRSKYLYGNRNSISTKVIRKLGSLLKSVV